jgi:hypothetical protein
VAGVQLNRVRLRGIDLSSSLLIRLVRTPTLEHRKVEFPGYVVRTPTLEHRKVEFPGYAPGDGLAASPGFCNEIGGLWPIAPCGRSSL